MNIVAHNLSAMNAQRQFGINVKSIAESTEKLSSGYQINRAADDAAGLAISEKLRRQVRGLTQGVENTQDGVSLCQVADGALAQVNDMLHRITELSVKAANGTNNKQERQYVQKEINQIIQEIDRIGDTTTFNERKLFSDVNNVSGGYVVDMGTDKWMLPTELKQETFSITYTGYRQTSAVFDGITYNLGDTITGTWLTFGEKGYRSQSSDPNTLHTLYQLIGAGLPIKSDNASDMNYMFSRAIEENSAIKSLSLDDLKVDDSGMIYIDNYSSSFNRVYASIDTSYYRDGVVGLAFSISNNYPGTDYLYATKIPQTEGNQDDNANTTWIQSGCESGQGINLTIDRMNASILGIEDLDVSTVEGANHAMDAVKGALRKVTDNRSKIGAQQNRLEHTIANEENVVENTTAAESRIRDTDMAKEMVRYSNINILEQVGHAMMAQANQSNQGVLSLLG